MHGRLTDHSRVVWELAQEEAREFATGYLGTEHILLGLLREPHGIAGRVLREDFGVTLEAAYEEVRIVAGQGRGAVPKKKLSRTKHTDRLMKELAVKEAMSLNCSYIATEHLLLGMLAATALEPDPKKARTRVKRYYYGHGVRILERFGLDYADVRQKVLARRH